MSTEKDECIKQAILDNKSRLATRSELISHGFSSEGFDALYDAQLVALGKTEPKQAMPSFLQTMGELPLTTSARHLRARSLAQKRNGIIIMVCVFICLVLFYIIGTHALPLIQKHFQTEPLLLQVGEELQFQTLEPIDTLMQAKVETTVTSGLIYYKRVSFVEGVCNDITVVAPVVCTETETSFAVFAPLSNGTYYCATIDGFRGNIEKRPVNKGVCN
jgi:hypothetical protein